MIQNFDLTSGPLLYDRYERNVQCNVVLCNNIAHTVEA